MNFCGWMTAKLSIEDRAIFLKYWLEYLFLALVEMIQGFYHFHSANGFVEPILDVQFLLAIFLLQKRLALAYEWISLG